MLKFYGNLDESRLHTTSLIKLGKCADFPNITGNSSSLDLLVYSSRRMISMIHGGPRWLSTRLFLWSVGVTLVRSWDSH